MLMQDAPAPVCRTTQPIPRYILNSPLMQRGGFAVYEGMLDEAIHTALLSEAAQQWSSARLTEQVGADDEEVRGGKPPRRLFSAPGGPTQDAFYHADWLLQYLSTITQTQVVTSGERGTYSFYHGSGHYLALHRDVEYCDLAVISCLQADDPGNLTHSVSGALRLYPTRYQEPLSRIRQTPDEGGRVVRLKVRQTLVLFGGIVPHEVLPVTDAATRIVSVLCYRVLA